ncbi:MAG: hypothetical protein OXE92_08255 [Bacteroidetes bacterium]|nr:hypothetical protein [Bacteroidota bacterium]MCY4205700.1 hypothetical protein [Bacteroidota bacterium]
MGQPELNKNLRFYSQNAQKSLLVAHFVYQFVCQIMQGQHQKLLAKFIWLYPRAAKAEKSKRPWI